MMIFIDDIEPAAIVGILSDQGHEAFFFFCAGLVDILRQHRIRCDGLECCTFDQNLP